MLKHKLLIADDEMGTVSFLSEFFVNKGYEVLDASNGNDAIKIFEKNRPDVILLDMRMGWGKDGLDVLEKVKKTDPTTKVIMMTAVADEDTIKKAYSLGADDYVIKPFSLKYLEDVVMLKLLNLEIERLGKGVTRNELKKSI